MAKTEIRVEAKPNFPLGVLADFWIVQNSRRAESVYFDVDYSLRSTRQILDKYHSRGCEGKKVMIPAWALYYALLNKKVKAKVLKLARKSGDYNLRIVTSSLVSVEKDISYVVHQHLMLASNNEEDRRKKKDEASYVWLKQNGAFSLPAFDAYNLGMAIPIGTKDLPVKINDKSITYKTKRDLEELISNYPEVARAILLTEFKHKKTRTRFSKEEHIVQIFDPVRPEFLHIGFNIDVRGCVYVDFVPTRDWFFSKSVAMEYDPKQKDQMTLFSVSDEGKEMHKLCLQSFGHNYPPAFRVY